MSAPTACAFGDELGPCESPAAWTLTAGGVRHPVCATHRDGAEDRLLDLELGRVVAERIALQAEGDEAWHWCDPPLLRAYLATGVAEGMVLSARGERLLAKLRAGEALTAEERAVVWG